MKKTTILWLLITSAFISAQQEFTVSVGRVTVWVKAVDQNGNSVRGLKSSDFQILQNGRPVDINCFEEVALSPRLVARTQQLPDPQTAQSQTVDKESTPANSDRVFAILLDFYNTSQPEYLFLKPKVREFIDQISTYRLPVTVGALLSNRRLGIVSPLTQEYERVKNQMNRFRANSQRDQSVMFRKREIIHLLERADGDETIIQRAYALARNFTRQEKNESEFSLSALQSFANRISAANAGKHIVLLYVSGGINSDPGRIYYDIVDRYLESLGEKADPSSITAMRFSAIREDNFNLQNEIKQSIGKLNKRNISIYSINTRGMVTPDAGNIYQQSAAFAFTDTELLREYQDTLDHIARETGGVSFKNSLNFKRGFDAVLTDLNHQYVLCFSPPEQAEPGKYHEIKVKTKLNGVKLRYRRGYTD